MKRSRYVLFIILVFVVLGAVTLASLFLGSLSRTPSVLSGSHLEIPLAGEIEEWASPTWLDTLFLGRTPLSVHDIWWNLRKARGDRRIQAVLLRLNPLLCDWAKVNELREAVLDFRRSGKKVYAYIEEAPEFDKEYFLATACDRVILHPLGWLGINGMGGSYLFYKKALDKLGIQVEVEQVEEFKTAYHAFTHEGFTPAHRLMTEAILRDRFEGYAAAVAKARNKSEAEVKAWIDKGFFHAEEALLAGLVDGLMFEDELRAALGEKEGAPRRLRHEDYARVRPDSLGLNRGRRVALIYAMGMILPGESLSDRMIGGQTLSRWIKRAREDRSVAAVILRVDSPGGSAVASDSIWREVALTKKVKPVVVSMSDLAGSGGYWISMGANKIVAQPQTLTGSIGVIFGKFNLKGLYDKLGIGSERLVIGEHADAFSTSRSFTPSEQEAVKKQILWIYDRFLDKAAEGRDKAKDEVDQAGRGRVWTGLQAKRLGLVDELGGLSKAVDLAKELAGISAFQDVSLDVWPRRASFWESLLGRRQAVMKPAPGSRFFKALAELEELLPRDRVLSLMPPTLFLR
jgi:protease-4